MLSGLWIASGLWVASMALAARGLWVASMVSTATDLLVVSGSWGAQQALRGSWRAW